MTSWITDANGIVVLITGLVGLISTAIGAYFAIKNWITALKGKKASEIWALIMELADAAMVEAEASAAAGEDKKKIVIDAVKAGCKAAGVNLDAFLDQLSEYIDSTITFANKLQANKPEK